MTVWLSADCHESHGNILVYAKRPFCDINEMNEALIERWNSLVKMKDTAYILGDVSLSAINATSVEKFLRRLNGVKCIVPSLDHDVRWVSAWKGMDGVVILPPLHTVRHKEFAIDGRGLLVTLCHYPLASWPASHYNVGGKEPKIVSIQLHGHHHGRAKKVLGQMDVGVDCWNGCPVSLEEVVNLLRSGREFRYPGWRVE